MKFIKYLHYYINVEHIVGITRYGAEIVITLSQTLFKHDSPYVRINNVGYEEHDELIEFLTSNALAYDIFEIGFNNE